MNRVLALALLLMAAGLFLGCGEEVGLTNAPSNTPASLEKPILGDEQVIKLDALLRDPAPFSWEFWRLKGTVVYSCDCSLPPPLIGVSVDVNAVLIAEDGRRIPVVEKSVERVMIGLTGWGGFVGMCPLDPELGLCLSLEFRLDGNKQDLVLDRAWLHRMPAAVAVE